MAMGVCGWIGAFLCCVLCSGMVCFIIFGGTVFVGFLALFTAVNNCEGADLEAAKLCIPITSELVNATINFEPKFESNQELEKLIKLCGDAARCIKNVNCVSHRVSFLKTERNHCDVYTFIKEEFGSCAEKLKKKAETENVKCLKFLFEEKKCENWVENQKCIDEEIQNECGVAMLKRFGTVSKEFLRGACKGSITARR